MIKKWLVSKKEVDRLNNRIDELERMLKDKTEVDVGPNYQGRFDRFLYDTRRDKEPVNEVVKLLLEHLKLEVMTKPAVNSPAKKELVPITTTDTSRYQWVEYGGTLSTTDKKKGKKKAKK